MTGLLHSFLKHLFVNFDDYDLQLRKTWNSENLKMDLMKLFHIIHFEIIFQLLKNNNL